MKQKSKDKKISLKEKIQKEKELFYEMLIKRSFKEDDISEIKDFFIDIINKRTIEAVQKGDSAESFKEVFDTVDNIFAKIKAIVVK